MLTLSGTAYHSGQPLPAATVQAFKAGRIGPKLPTPGTAPPASPDATATADGGGNFTLTTPTNEDYTLCFVGSSPTTYDWETFPLGTQASGTTSTTTPATGATQRVNAGAAAPGQSLKNYVGKVALSASAATTVTLETVAPGKAFYITDIYLSHDSAQVIDVRLQAAGVDIFRSPVKGDTAPVQMAGMETQPSAQAGQVVTLLYPTQASPPNAYYNIFGFEQ